MELQFNPLLFHQLTSMAAIPLMIIISSVIIFLYNLRINKSTNGGDKSNKNKMNKKKSTAEPLPEALGAWPIIGHLHLFKANELIHVTLGNMADKYGPAFLLRFGSHKTLVVSNSEMVKECFTAPNDKLFSNRTANDLWIRLMFYGSNSYGFTPYGQYWRGLSKLSTQKLLSNQRMEAIKHLRIEEVEASFRQLYKLCNDTNNNTALVNMDDWLSEVMFNVIGRIVSGYESNKVTRGATSGERFKVAMNEAMRLMGHFAVSDVIPWLGWVDRLRGLTGEMKRCGKDLDAIIGCLIEEHRHKRQLCGNKPSGGDVNNLAEQDFIDICLSMMEQSQLPGDDPEIVIKSIILDMMAGGNHTTKLVMTWTLSLLLNHRHVLKKAKDEVDGHLGSERQLDDSDIPKLQYIQAILKESMRLFPASPVFERMTMEDCEVGGFHVPAGTRLFVNVWKIQRDPSMWEDPSEFRPERFLTSKCGVDVKGQHYELIPFGTGRRICPGVSFSLQVWHLVLARLIHNFEMTIPMDAEVDMTGGPGLFNNKLTPLEVLITPRLRPAAINPNLPKVN